MEWRDGFKAGDWLTTAHHYIIYLTAIEQYLAISSTETLQRRFMNFSKIQKRCSGCLILLALFALHSNAQIPVSINSGNPSCPFPQFLAYNNPTAKLGNLATKNSIGVTHAEMEKSIREAYQIMMNRATKPGGGVGGIDYIKFRSTPQCSEGDGYGLLGAAAMADKATFDGMWLYIHDYTLNKVKRYRDCQESSPGYAYSQHPGWTGAGANSAADGDVDIGLALLTAYYQWGEFMGIQDACGNQISYKQAAIDFLKALTDTLTHPASGSLLSGDIGIDGYFKSGDSWAELSGWATAQNTATIGITKQVEQPGPTEQYFDYTAPSYFHQFADFLAGLDSAQYAWNIHQFRRAEASSDWLIGELFKQSPRNIPFAGKVSLDSTSVATFENFNTGEDFRLAWRTILNYVWHGNLANSWDPSTHRITAATPNTYERDMGQRYARFLWDNRQAPWNNPCVSGPSSASLPYWGPSVLRSSWKVDGTEENFPFLINWIHGTGSTSAVAAQDFNLMAEMYRQCEITWNVETPGDGYLTSVPYYYHGWFRLLGMLVLSGNYPAPSSVKPSANMKVYLDIDKITASPNDTIIYTIDYRNYGSMDASGVTIVDSLPQDFTFVSATGSGIHNATAHTVTWNIGTVPGFKTATGISPTTGQVQLKVVVENATHKQYRNKVTVSCSNGTGWTSNDYPNTVSSVMKRNFLDIISRPAIVGSSDAIVFPLHGGRPGVHFSFSSDNSATSIMHTIRFRMFNDAQEPYINRGNYRFSYFLYDTLHNGLAGQPGVTNGWEVMTTIREGIDKVTLLHQNLTPGSDTHGKWNQRIIFQFSDTVNTAQLDTNWQTMGTVDKHLEEYRGMRSNIHRGQLDLLRFIAYINSTTWSNVQWSDDWSWDSATTGTDGDPGYPITPDLTDPDPNNQGNPVNSLNPKHCASATKTVDNILVEEWDGYTWRRVFGNYPASLDTVPVHTSLATEHLFSVQTAGRHAIRYSLPCPAVLHIQILDIQGRVVATLHDGYQQAGTHSNRLDRYRTGSSAYIVRISSGKQSYLKKIISLH